MKLSLVMSQWSLRPLTLFLNYSCNLSMLLSGQTPLSMCSMMTEILLYVHCYLLQIPHQRHTTVAKLQHMFLCVCVRVSPCAKGSMYACEWRYACMLPHTNDISGEMWVWISPLVIFNNLMIIFQFCCALCECCLMSLQAFCYVKQKHTVADEYSGIKAQMHAKTSQFCLVTKSSSFAAFPRVLCCSIKIHFSSAGKNAPQNPRWLLPPHDKTLKIKNEFGGWS